MVTVVEELERALQLASGNLGNIESIRHLCPPGPVENPGSYSVFGPLNPRGTSTSAAPSPGSHTSNSSLDPNQLRRSPAFLLSSPNNHSTSLTEVKSEPAVELEEPRYHPVDVGTEEGLNLFKIQNSKKYRYCIRAPPRRERYWKVYPQRPRNFLRLEG